MNIFEYIVKFLYFAYEIIIPIAELGVGVINVVYINEMIQDPDSGYGGNQTIFDDVLEWLQPYPNETSSKLM